MFVGDLDEFLDWRDIAKHRIHTLKTNQLAFDLWSKAGQTLVEAFRVIMTEADCLRARKLTPIINTGVTVCIN